MHQHHIKARVTSLSFGVICKSNSMHLKIMAKEVIAWIQMVLDLRCSSWIAVVLTVIIHGISFHPDSAHHNANNDLIFYVKGRALLFAACYLQTKIAQSQC